jgi:kinesin family protein C2/C3
MAAAAAGGALSMFSVVEDVLQQHGTRIGDLDLVESRKAEQAGT